jgi:hypothetical protein
VHFQGGDVEKGLAELDKPANVMIEICSGGPQP